LFGGQAKFGTNPNDLSISLGILDQMNSETLLKAIDRVVETAKKRKKATVF